MSTPAAVESASRPGRAAPGVGAATAHQGAASRSEPALLAATGVDVVLGGSTVLTAVDAQVRSGEVVALVGPNGAGKSTLLAVLAGDITPDAGRVALDGVDLRDVDVATMSRRRAVQMQEARLSFAFTVVEVVRMGRTPWQGTSHEDRDEDVIARALQITETSTFAHRKFPTLSGGERARTSFSRVLSQETAALLLDEPTAALDIRHQEAVLGHARERAEAGVGVVVVLHDLSLAAAYADRIVLLDRGRVRADGPPAQVLTPGLLSDVYGHPIAVIDHPASGGLVVLPVRAARRHDTEESPS